MKIILNTFITASLLLAVRAASAQNSVIVTYAENPNQEVTSLQNTQVETFNSLSAGYNSNVVWNGVGTFNQLYILQPNQYGGATDATHPQGTKYAVEGVGTQVSSSTLTLNQSAAYFGMWWSAGDASNVLKFYDNNRLIAQFTTASLLSSLGRTYDGNPRNRSLDASEPFAFINFYGSAGASWNKIVLTNNSSSGFEADNFTVRNTTYNPKTDGPTLPGVPVARVTGTTTTKVAPTAKGAALWGSAGAVPGAPAPPVALLAAFGLCAALKARQNRKSATLS